MEMLYSLMEILSRRNINVHVYTRKKLDSLVDVHTITDLAPDNAAIIDVVVGKRIKQQADSYVKGSRLSKDEYFLHISNMLDIINDTLDALFYQHYLNYLLDCDTEKRNLVEAYTTKFILGELTRQVVYTERGIYGMTKSFFFRRLPSLLEKKERQGSSASNKAIPTLVEYSDGGEIVDYGTVYDDSFFSDYQDPHQLQQLYSQDRTICLKKAAKELLDSGTLQSPVQIAVIGKKLNWPEFGDQSLLKILTAEEVRTQVHQAKARLSVGIAKLYPVPPEVTLEMRIKRIEPRVLEKALDRMEKIQTIDGRLSVSLIKKIADGVDLSIDTETCALGEGELRRLKTKASALLTKVIRKLNKSTAKERKAIYRHSPTLYNENEKLGDVTHYTKAPGELSIKVNPDGTLSGCIVKRIKLDNIKRRSNELSMLRRKKHHQQMEQKKRRKRRAYVMGRKRS